MTVGSTQLEKTGDTKKTGPVSRIIKSLKATPSGGASTEAAATGGQHRAKPTGGLGSLVKKLSGADDKSTK